MRAHYYLQTANIAFEARHHQGRPAPGRGTTSARSRQQRHPSSAPSCLESGHSISLGTSLVLSRPGDALSRSGTARPSPTPSVHAQTPRLACLDAPQEDPYHYDPAVWGTFPKEVRPATNPDALRLAIAEYVARGTYVLENGEMKDPADCMEVERLKAVEYAFIDGAWVPSAGLKVQSRLTVRVLKPE